MLAIIIVGTGFTAAMQLFVTTTEQNQSAGSMTVAINLGNNIQELMAGACYTNPNAAWPWAEKTPVLSDVNRDIDDYDQATYNPPKDGGGQDLATAPLNRYTQHIDVSMVSRTDFKTVVTADQGVRKVVVSVLYKAPSAATAGTVYTLTFYRFNDMSFKGPGE